MLEYALVSASWAQQEERSCLPFPGEKQRPSYRASYKKWFQPGRLVYLCSNIRSQAIFFQKNINCNLKHTVPVRLFVVSYLQPARCQFQLLLVFSSTTQKSSQKRSLALSGWDNCQFSLPVFPDKSVHHHSLLLWKWICSVRAIFF